MRVGGCTGICRVGARARDGGAGSRPRARAAQPDTTAEPGPAGFSALMSDGFIEATHLPAPGRAASAARAFSAGNGFLTGQVINRFI